MSIYREMECLDHQDSTLKRQQFLAILYTRNVGIAGKLCKNRTIFSTKMRKIHNTAMFHVSILTYWLSSHYAVCIVPGILIYEPYYAACLLLAVCLFQLKWTIFIRRDGNPLNWTYNSCQIWIYESWLDWYKWQLQYMRSEVRRMTHLWIVYMQWTSEDRITCIHVISRYSYLRWGKGGWNGGGD